MSQGPNTFPYFSPTVPFGVYITNLNGPSLVLTPPALVNNPFQIIKTTANTNKMIISNSVENTTFGLDANGDARWSATGRQFINGDRLQIDTTDGMVVNTTTGLPLTINGNVGDTSMLITKSFNDQNDILMTTPNGNLALGLTPTGQTHFDTSLGTTVQAFTIGSVPLKIIGNSGNPMALDISKPSPNVNYTFTGNSNGYTTYGVNALGETDILTTLKTNFNTPRLEVNSTSGVLISTPSLNTNYPLTVQGGSVIDESVVVSKASATRNVMFVSNTAGELTVGVDAAGIGQINTSKGIKMTSTSGTPLEIFPPTAIEFPLTITKTTATNRTKILLVNSAGGTAYGLNADGSFEIDGGSQCTLRSSKLFIDSSSATKLQINGFTTGNLISDISGNISVGTLVPPDCTVWLGGATPLGVTFPAVPSARYHRVTIVAGGGGGGFRNGNCSAGGGGGGSFTQIIVAGNTQYDFIVGTRGLGATTTNTDGGGGGNTQFKATAFGGIIYAYSGLGGKWASNGGNFGEGGEGGYTALGGGPFPWLRGFDAMLLRQSGGDGQAGNNFFQQGINGGGTLLCAASGGAPVNFNAQDGSGRGGGGWQSGSGNGGNGGSGSVQIETFY